MEHRWERIANILPYTRFPDSDVTKLCLEVAKFLNQRNPSKKVYQYLMTTVQLTEDKTSCLDRTNIDQYTLDELSENQEALIPPFEVLSRLDTKSDLLLEQITNPFSATGATPLTPNEQRRIIEFSSITVKLYDTFQLINALKRQSTSLGGHIQRLIDAFRAGGKHGGNGGTKADASGPAHEGLLKFLEYWETLPQEDKDKTKNLPHSYGESTYTLAENLIAASYLHNCAEEHATALSTMLKHHNDALFQINDNSTNYSIIKLL